MPSYKTLFTGKYLASPDLGKNEPTVKIERITSELVKDEEKRTERHRWIAFFAGKDKGMLLNRSNAILIAAICKSDKTEDWIGHRITIGVREVKMGGETVDGLRVIGSPELDRPLVVEIKLPRKKPLPWTLAPTPAATKAAPPPERDPGAEG